MMANIKIKNKKVLAVIIAFAMVLGLVAPAVFVFAADTHLIGSDTQSGENAATTYVNGLETAKTADDLGDGQYRINLAAKATSATLTPTPTDFELVLDMSGSMNDTLYSRDYKNLKNLTTFTEVSLMDSKKNWLGQQQSVTHDDMYDSKNPYSVNLSDSSNWIISIIAKMADSYIKRTREYTDDKYIEDPTNPGVFIYLAQTYEVVDNANNIKTMYGDYYVTTGGKKVALSNPYGYSLVNAKTKNGVNYIEAGGLDIKIFNRYTYTFTDSEGNIWQSKNYYAYLSDVTGGNDAIGDEGLTFYKVNDPTQEHVIHSFFHKDSDSAKVTCENLYNTFQSKGLYIVTDEGKLERVYMLIKSASDPKGKLYVTDYIFYISPDGTYENATYVTHQGNEIYGAKNAIFQGFKKVLYTTDDNGKLVPMVNSRGEYAIDHENSIEHMTLYSGESENVTNLLALQESLETFLINIHQDACDKNVDQRVGITTFNNDKSIKLSLGDKDSHVMYEAIANKVINKVYSLDAHNGTRVDLGMQVAKSEFDTYSKEREKERKTVAIVFTDGKPSESLGSDFSLSKANAAIKTSNQMKTQLGTEVYTVGMLKYADESKLHGDTYFHFDWRGTGKNNVPCNGNVGSSWGATWSSTWNQKTDASGPIDAGAINRFLNYLSSNSPDATDLGLSQVTALFQQGWKVKKNYTVNQEPPHYFAVSTATFGGYNEDGTAKPDIITSPEELNANLVNAFHQIAESVKVPSTVIDGTTILHDTITPYFDYAGELKVTENGVDITDKVTVTADAKTGIVEVTGYDYGANVNKELVVSFLVRRGEDFIGGQNVPTNGIDAGIYDKDRLLEANFPVPLVDVPLQFNNAVTGQSVYYSYEADLTKLINTDTLNGVNNNFADVVFTITDDHGNTVGTYTVPAGETIGSWNDGFNAENAYPQVYEDTQYSVTYVVSDTEETLTDTADAKVYVWVPEITVADGETTVGNREDITPELTWVPADNHNVSEIPALDETADPQVSYKVKDVETNEEVSDLDNHLFTANQNFQVYDVTLADRTFVYYTTELQKATENVYDDNHNIIDTIEIKDDGGNPIWEEVSVEHQLERAAADVTAVTKFANKTNADDQTPSEYEWTLSKYSLVIGTEFAGDYANPEDVTYTVTDEDGTVVGTASFSKKDFTGLKANQPVEIKNLAPGKTYTVTKTSGAEKYIVTFTAKDANDATVTDTDDKDEVFGFNYNGSADTVNLLITNTFDENNNPPASGIDGGTNLAHLVATIMFALAGVLGVCEVSYIAYLRVRN